LITELLALSRRMAGGSLAAVLIGVAALLLYSINLERLPDGDELYHILAGEGLLATGEPAIGEDGRYWRGYPTTWLVAQSIALFGSSLTAARLPSVVLMAALVVAVFVFLRREANPLAAWIGAGLFALSPFAIAVAQFARFYSLQGLSFFLGVWLLYLQVGRPWPLWRHTLTALPAGLLIAFAVQLQPTALFGAAGLGLWIAGILLLPWLLDRQVPIRTKILVVAGLALAAVLALVGAWAIGLLDELWGRYRTAMLFNELRTDEFWFYHGWYILYYPTLWTLSGVIAVCALIERPRPAGFALTIFVVGFLFSSFAAAKNLRYLFFAQPFLFVLWGIGLAYMVTAAQGLLGRLRDGLVPAFTWRSERHARAAAGLFLGLALLSVVIVNPAWLRSVTMLADVAIPPQPPRVDWAAAEPVLGPWIERAEVVVTTEELGMLYYYRRADVLLSASKWRENASDELRPFMPDFRSDVPLIAEAESLTHLIDCHATGLFVTHRKWWGETTFGPEATMRDVEVERLIKARATPLPLPDQSQLLAFVWEYPAPVAAAADCADLPTFADHGADIPLPPPADPIDGTDQSARQDVRPPVGRPA
jgi:hypothetical protein